MRTFKTISIVIGIYVVAMIMELIMASSSPDYEGGIGVSRKGSLSIDI